MTRALAIDRLYWYGRLLGVGGEANDNADAPRSLSVEIDVWEADYRRRVAVFGHASRGPRQPSVPNR